MNDDDIAGGIVGADIRDDDGIAGGIFGNDGWDDVAGGILLPSIVVLIGLWLLDQVEGAAGTNKDWSLVRRGSFHPSEPGDYLLHFFLRLFLGSFLENGLNFFLEPLFCHVFLWLGG